MHPVVAHGSPALVSARRRIVLERTLTGRFWLRWHVALMLAGAFCAGFLVNVGLLHAPVHSIVVRWLVALVCGYVAWFALMRGWLAYVGVRPFVPTGSGAVDLGSGADVGTWPGGVARSAPGGFAGGGGTAGGAGASGSFDASAVATSGRVPLAVPTGSSGAFDVGDALSGDDGFLLVVLGAVVLALVASLGGVVIYMVHEAPHLLVDVACGSALASGMAGTTRRVTTSLDWCGSVWRATWKPFVLLAVGVLACAITLAYVFPGARTLGEAMALWRS